MSAPATRPDSTEAAPYYFTYIDRVGPGDILDILDSQLADASDFFGAISEEESLHRYAPGKWSIREVLAHINDTERLFAFRTLWFARALPASLPSFDQEAAMEVVHADERTWRSHVEEFGAVRSATLALFGGLDDEAWTGRGVASDVEFTVRAIAYIVVGHVEHHLAILRERYL